MAAVYPDGNCIMTEAPDRVRVSWPHYNMVVTSYGDGITVLSRLHVPSPCLATAAPKSKKERNTADTDPNPAVRRHVENENEVGPPSCTETLHAVQPGLGVGVRCDGHTCA